ncbi:MAG: transcription activator effector binding protein [Ferruginibacter sp.]|nr:transcription activator effector binding protein [Ferruginibacter sp.]
MKKNKYGLLSMLLFCIVLISIACGNNQTDKQVTAESKKDTPLVKESVAETAKGPVININDTLSVKRMVLTMKDSAANMERVGMKLGEIYGVKLGAIIKKYNLKTTGAPVAWYKGPKAPYFFEAGIPVDKKPSKMPPGAYMKQIGTDSIVVAHFYGPYNLLPQAYEALGEWIKDHKKTLKGAPYEIYVGDPLDAQGKPKDPYKVQTDVVFSWK